MSDLLSACQDKPMVPGICKEAFCDGICSVEPDETAGFCWECERETIRSSLIFAGTH